MMIKSGQTLVIPNVNRKFGADKNYVLIWTANEIPLLFTEHEYTAAADRAKANPEDIEAYAISNSSFVKLLVILALLALGIVYLFVRYNFAQ